MGQSQLSSRIGMSIDRVLRSLYAISFIAEKIYKVISLLMKVYNKK